MQVSTVGELIEALSKCDPSTPMRTIKKGEPDEENHWVGEVEIFSKGQSGYEISGEVVLTTSE